MRLGKCRLTTASILFLFAFAIPNAITAQTVVQSPDQILAEATKASLDGDYKTALSKSRNARQAATGDLSFGIRYISALTSMAELSDQRHRSALFNEALKAANQVEVSNVANGSGDAQTAWLYMTAIGKLADALADTSTTTTSKLYVAQSKVAANLKTNPGYPRESLQLLAEPMMSKAYAFAIENDADATAQSIQAAFDAGFTNFEKLHENQFVKGLNSDKVNALIDQRFVAYKKELKKWAHESVARFSAFDFRFDVADIEAGRIRNTDFRGRILVLDLWATWCPPCRESIPHFVKLDEQFRGENVDVVGISLDSPDDPGKSLKVVRQFVDDNGVEYAMAMGNRSVLNQLAPGQKLPTVLFIDPRGRVRYIAEGPHNFYQLAAITNELIELENDSPTSAPVQNGF